MQKEQLYDLLMNKPIPKSKKQHDVKINKVEILEAEVGELRDEVQSAKTWAKSFGVFLSLCLAVMETVRRLFP